MTQSRLLEGLNPEQLQAVTHKSGPLLIIAGAGTGKTKVITHRIAWLIEQKLAKPSEILALTFTEKAAAEMEQRVDVLVPYGFIDTWISTFHAFGDRIIRDYALELGLPANFKVLTQTQQAIFIHQNLYAFDLKYFRPISNPLSHIEALIKHFSRLKDELIAPEDYLEYANDLIKNPPATPEQAQACDGGQALELAKAYERYCDLMIQAGNLDFGDQIFLAYRLLKENKKVLKECQEKFKYILVDEFQDTNYAQNELVKLLVGNHGNITVVGDDDQAIYRFRGASISNILDFKKTYPQAQQIVLNQNYRSTCEILDASYKLIQHNNPDRLEAQNQINKKLQSSHHGNQPELLYSQTLSAEADSVVSKISNLKPAYRQGRSQISNLSYNDFAILVRANSHAQPFIDSLNIKGIPHIFSGASGLYSQPEIKMLIAFLKCLVYTDDNLSHYQLATSELYNIDHQTMSKLYTISRRTNQPISDLFHNNTCEILDTKSGLLAPQEISSPTRDAHVKRTSFGNKIEQLINDINKYQQQKNEGVGELLYEYLTEKKYLKNLLGDLSVENELKIYNIAKFFDRIAQFNHSSQERGVLAFLENLELVLSYGEEIISSDIDPDIDAVNILTVHAAKGLEWPVVFVANCVSDRFPSRNFRDPLPIPDELIKEKLPSGDFHLQEERRLFYVASTRAKEYLFLTSAEDYGGKRTKKLSQFVLELLDEAKPDKIKYHLSSIEKIEKFKKMESQIPKLPDKFCSNKIKLSRQQIDDYFTCPKKFYFAHIIKIPLLENHQLMYGVAIHEALNRYFTRKINGNKTNLAQLLSDYQEAFKNVGFITVEHEKQRYRQGIETLTKFYNNDLNDTQIPYKVEQMFEFEIGNTKINGRYDLVYKLGNQLNDQVPNPRESAANPRESAAYEIRDFKTSDVKNQKDADRRISQSSQMMIYALAWYEQYGVIPKTTLYFIESGLKSEKIYNQRDLEGIKQMIVDTSSGIKKHDFTAKPDRFSCQYCPYKDICPDRD